MPIAHTVAQSMHNHAARHIRTLKELRQLQSHRAACELPVIDSGCTNSAPLLPVARRNTTTLA